MKKRNRQWDSLFPIFLFLIFAVPAVFLSAQTATDEMETLLGTGAVTYAQAARFALEASNAAIISDREEAFRFASERGWLPRGAAPGRAARLDGISLLLMRSFDLKGGIMYSLFKNPHFAYREMLYKNLIQGRVDPHMTVSGINLLFFTGRILSFKDEGPEVAMTEQN